MDKIGLHKEDELSDLPTAEGPKMEETGLQSIRVTVVGRREMSQWMNADARAWEMTMSFPEARSEDPRIEPTPCLMATEAVLAEMAELLTPRITGSEARSEAVDVFISALNLVLVMGDSSELMHTLVDKLKSRRSRGYEHLVVDNVLTHLLQRLAKLPERDMAFKASADILRERWRTQRSVPDFSVRVPEYGDNFTYLSLEDDRDGVYDGRD